MALKSSRMLLFLLICIGSLALQPDRAYCLTNVDLVLRHSVNAQKTMAHRPRILQDKALQRMKAEKQATNSNKSFDPNQSSTRRVRRGADPIHNRSDHT
ncbi:hypothetical protein K2173_021955 [Erythroxylum novogranatense]|uniref:CLAVATA3/ESR (CLE)-related protein 45 n=1 Tax=Erythroxylum novogranatense TaxID=1862640 RepID=A0AAV8T2D7_9ROSI|nr:hypothetical protein K2173_021955 [Erythroxylum novogranatense]